MAEIPTIWLDRAFGVSNFKMSKWLPAYLRWYRFAYGGRMTTDQLSAWRVKRGHAVSQPAMGGHTAATENTTG